ncbi:MAG: MotA/TolQ/ExbB proton channel family protein [Gemmataceae bacterium]|nr:MotA/TolQ/ExbB proton channel family protein [Gemmataceae bacterium]
MAQPQDPSPLAEAPPDAGEPSFVSHFLRSIGWVFGTIFLFLSMSLVALVVMLALDLRMAVAIPPGFVEAFTDTVNQRKFKEAFDMARADNSFLGRVIANGMARLQYGLEDARDAAFNTVASLRSQKEQLINYVAVISSLGPYIGLVGTVFGMILSFKALAQPGARVEAQRLADGISHALVVTMVGIGLAVPGLFFTVFFRNRVTKISMDTENLADDLLTQMYHNSKRPTAPTTGTPPAPPPASESRAASPAKS